MRLEVWQSGAYWSCDDAPMCRCARHYEGGKPDGELFAAQLMVQQSFTRLWCEVDRLYPLIKDVHFVVARVRQKARQRAYAWLALQLGIDAAELHIGTLSANDCRRAITLCRATSDKAIREWAKNETTGVTR